MTDLPELVEKVRRAWRTRHYPHLPPTPSEPDDECNLAGQPHEPHWWMRAYVPDDPLVRLAGQLFPTANTRQTPEYCRGEASAVVRSQPTWEQVKQVYDQLRAAFPEPVWRPPKFYANSDRVVFGHLQRLTTPPGGWGPSTPGFPGSDIAVLTGIPVETNPMIPSGMLMYQDEQGVLVFLDLRPKDEEQSNG